MLADVRVLTISPTVYKIPTVLTWRDLEKTVAVEPHYAVVLVLQVVNADRTAVATLVGGGQVLQNHPEDLLGLPKSQSPRQGVVVANEGEVARAHVARAVLVAVGVEEPDLPHGVGLVHQAALVTDHLDGGAFGADVALVTGGDSDGRVRLVHLAIGWTERQLDDTKVIFS